MHRNWGHFAILKKVIQHGHHHHESKPKTEYMRPFPEIARTLGYTLNETNNYRKNIHNLYLNIDIHEKQHENNADSAHTINTLSSRGFESELPICDN